MKRYLLSAGLIIASLAYVISQHLGGSDNHVVTPPVADNSQAPSSDTATTQTPTYASASTSTASTVTTSTATPAPTPVSTGQYQDGTYTGSVADAFYGYVEVEAVISGGKLTDVKILQYPNDRSTSRYINSQALPYLTQEAVAAQNANIDTVSGASDTSAAFRESLSSALASARA